MKANTIQMVQSGLNDKILVLKMSSVDEILM